MHHLFLKFCYNVPWWSFLCYPHWGSLSLYFSSLEMFSQCIFEYVSISPCPSLSFWNSMSDHFKLSHRPLFFNHCLLYDSLWRTSIAMTLRSLIFPSAICIKPFIFPEEFLLAYIIFFKYLEVSFCLYLNIFPFLSSLHSCLPLNIT